jgi:hypothetical protein
MSRRNRWLDESIPYRMAEVDRRLRELVEATDLPGPRLGVTLEAGPFGRLTVRWSLPGGQVAVAETYDVGIARPPGGGAVIVVPVDDPEPAYMDLLPSGVVIRDTHEPWVGEWIFIDPPTAPIATPT